MRGTDLAKKTDQNEWRNFGRPSSCSALELLLFILTNSVTYVCEANLLRVADPSFVAACQQHTVSRYYSCDTNAAGDTEILNDRIWLTCPTYIGRSCRQAT